MIIATPKEFLLKDYLEHIAKAEYPEATSDVCRIEKYRLVNTTEKESIKVFLIINPDKNGNSE